MNLLFLIIFYEICLSFGASNVDYEINENVCEKGSLAVYQIELEGNWTEDNFPKNYPKFRPHAHFSKSYGISHTHYDYLFRIQEVVRPELENFCLKGDIEELHAQISKENIFDELIIPKLDDPSKKVEARFFVSSNHSLFSIVTKIVPSPDWIIGIDSLQLCIDNKWVDEIRLEMQPIDCGVNSGFTFSSPFWDTVPRDEMTLITSHFPNNHASSFYYQNITHLPPIASFRVHKIKEYIGVKDSSVKRIHQKYRRNTMKIPSRHANHDNLDCIVSKWSEWSSCSKACGIGEKFRNRSIVRLEKTGGKACPHLVERSWCGSSRCESSSSSYFSW